MGAANDFIPMVKMTSITIPTAKGAVIFELETTGSELIGVGITREGDVIVFVAIVYTTRIGVAVFALGVGGRCVTITLGCTRGGVSGTGSPASGVSDTTVGTMTDITDLLAGSRVAGYLSVIAVGVGGPEARPVAAVGVTVGDAVARATC